MMTTRMTEAQMEGTNCGADERGDNSIGRNENEEVDVNNGDKDVEEERTNKGKSGSLHLGGQH
jgi:hypothetical protein